jgi:RHS repeat-associated protein
MTYSHFTAFSNKCTKGKKMALKSGTNAYLYSFNGKEKIDELNGAGNELDFGARIYDARLGRWMSVDPFFQLYSGISPFSNCINNPINFIDWGGNFVIPVNLPENQKEFAKRVIAAASQILNDPYALEIFMKHSGLSKNEILAIFTEGYGPTVTFGCPTDNFIMVYEGKGNTTFGEMGITWGVTATFNSIY